MDESSMEQEIIQLKRSMMEICKNNQDIFQVISHLGNAAQEARLYILQLNTIIDNVKYEILDPRTQKKELFFPEIRSREETIEKIVTEKRSMARFGDGEFSIMENFYRQKFQKLDNKLAKRLEEVVRTDDERILIGLADNYGNLEQYNKTAADGIRIYMTEEVREKHQKYLSTDRVYYDAYISRPYVMMKDRSIEATKKRFANIQRIWDKREVIIVEGALTRMGMGNDLLSNAKSVKRILAPATSSFDRYDEILEASLRYAKEDVLFLIAMGPSAGVLAYDLTQEGYQAIDIGHVDLEYEWFLAGKGERVPVKNKYNNEIEGGDTVEETELPREYLLQILERFD